MQAGQPDPFRVLGVPATATDDEVKAAYRALAKKFHPDVNRAKDAATKFKEATEAYAVSAQLSATGRGARACQRLSSTACQRPAPLPARGHMADVCARSRAVVGAPQAIKSFSAAQREARQRTAQWDASASGVRQHMRARMEEQAAAVSRDTRGEAAGRLRRRGGWAWGGVAAGGGGGSSWQRRRAPASRGALAPMC